MSTFSHATLTPTDPYVLNTAPTPRPAPIPAPIPAPAPAGIVNTGAVGGADRIARREARRGAAGGAGAVSAPTDPLSQFAPPNPVDYQPVLAEVQRPQTVQGQIGDILKTGNPLLEAAKARAMQTANARGLMNSSIAAQAGEEAVVNTALPIAQADAARYGTVADRNQEITNQFIGTKLGAQIDLNKAYEAFKQNNYLFDKDSALKTLLQRNDIESSQKIAAMQKEASLTGAQISADASMYNANLSAETQRLGLQADKENAELNRVATAALSQSGQSAAANSNFMSGVMNINLSDKPLEEKTIDMNNWFSLGAGNADITLDLTLLRTVFPDATPQP
jgi:hypothetical protein